MTENEINNAYINRFIESMEKDFEKWTMRIYSGMDGSFHEYHSPDYTNEVGTRISFGFGSCTDGAWINGHLSWRLPLMNLFSKRFWRFKRSERKVKSFLINKERREYLTKLKESI